MAVKTSVETNINALKGWLVIIGDSFHLWSSDPSGETMRCPLQRDKSSVLLCPSCWLNYALFSTQHLLIGLIDFPVLQPPQLHFLLPCLTVASLTSAIMCTHALYLSVQTLPAAGAARAPPGAGPHCPNKNITIC